MKDWTVNPPPKESVANRADNRITVGRELPSLRPRGVPDGAAGASTRSDSDHAAAAPAAATGRNSRKKCWSDGSDGTWRRNSAGAPAARAPIEPAAAAMALYRPKP